MQHMVTPITLGFRAAATRVVFKSRSNLDQRITNGGDEVAEVAEILSYDQTCEVVEILSYDHWIFLNSCGNTRVRFP
jgi:hypothetical protein